MNRNFHSYHWIYCKCATQHHQSTANILVLGAGPILGAILAAGFYKFIKVLEYETANPAQDTDGANLRPQTAESMMEQGGRRGSKEWQQSHRSNGSNTTSGTCGTHGPNGNGAYANQNGGYIAASNSVTSGVAEKPPVLRRGTTQPGNVRRESNTQRLESPAMGTVDDAFHGLSGGMHGDEAPRRIIT